MFLNEDLQQEFSYLQVSRKTIVPSVWFGGYHPDVCLVTKDGAAVKTPLDDYNSIVAIASYKKGLSVAEAVKRFNANTYRAAGYFDIWALEKSHILPRWKSMGYDLAPAFRRWSMRGAFMFSGNHPHIACLYDIATHVTRAAGFEPVVGDESLLPHDNLKHGPIYPVYPEIGEALGVQGSYWFKRPNRYGLLSLEQFVAESYASYAQADKDALQVSPVFTGRYDLVFNAI
ncbi:hypothetical protein DF039_12380 [Burkholderia cenocepacia]|nr:hypothetical protein DF039_12380 [Burkholderia cenocepacia]